MITCESIETREQAAMPARVRRLRRKLGLTQEQMAERLGTTNITVHHWEHGQRAPSPMASKLIGMLEQTIDCCCQCHNLRG